MQDLDREFKAGVMDEFIPVAAYWGLVFESETRLREGITISFANHEKALSLYREFGDPGTIAILSRHLHRGIGGMHQLTFQYVHDDGTGSSPLLLSSIRKHLIKVEIGRVPFSKFGDFRAAIRALSQYLLEHPEVVFPDKKGLRKLSDAEEEDE